MASSISFKNCTQITWKIENLHAVDTLSSDVFYFDCSQWRLILQRSQLPENDNVIYVYLKKLSPCIGIQNIDVYSFIEAPFEPRYLQHRTTVTISCNLPLDVWYTYEVDALVNVLEMNRVLTFVCRLTGGMVENANTLEDIKISDNKSVQTPLYMDATPCLKHAIVDVVKVLKGNTGPDVVLKCTDGFLSAHRAVLSARSEVFAAMFRNNMSESRSGAVNISDVDLSVMQSLIQYMYYGKLRELSMDSAEYIYVAADKYAIISLKELCSVFMIENMTERSACSLLALADGHNDKSFKEEVVYFILEKSIPLMDDVWNKFCQEYPNLAIEVLNYSYRTQLNS